MAHHHNTPPNDNILFQTDAAIEVIEQLRTNPDDEQLSDALWNAYASNPEYVRAAYAKLSAQLRTTPGSSPDRASPDIDKQRRGSDPLPREKDKHHHHHYHPHGRDHMSRDVVVYPNDPKLPCRIPNHETAPAINVTCKADIRNLMKEAARKNLAVRAVGGGYSASWYNPISYGGMRIQTYQDLKGIWNIAQQQCPLHDCLRDDIDGKRMLYLWECLAGTTIDDINKVLTSQIPLQALKNQTGFASLTLIGTAAVSAQGSGDRSPAQQDMIRSLRLMTYDADRHIVEYQIEPKTNALTDPAKFAQKFSTKEVTLIQDDDIFWCCVTAMGCFGIIYSIVIESEDGNYWLDESRTFMKWSAIQAELDDMILRRGNFAPENMRLQSFEIWVNPYGKHSSEDLPTDLNAVLSTYKIIPIGSKVGKRPIEVQTFGRFWDIADIAADLASAGAVDGDMGHAARGILNTVMRGTTKPNTKLPIQKALNFGSPNREHVFVCAAAVDVKDWKYATDQLIIVLNKAKRDGLVCTSPFSLRFVAGSPAKMSIQYGASAVVMLEVPLVESTVGSHELLLRVVDRLTRPDIQARPHWGIEPIFSHDLLKLWPPKNVDSFRKAFAKFNCSGMFNNQFTKLMGFTVTDAPPAPDK